MSHLAEQLISTQFFERDEAERDIAAVLIASARGALAGLGIQPPDGAIKVVWEKRDRVFEWHLVIRWESQ